MQTVASGFTAEERSDVRQIAYNLQVSWKRESTLGTRQFTVGVSSIGGSDVIGINPGAIGSAGNYKYFDESDNVVSLRWERELTMPLGGISSAMAEAELDNTSGRYTPRSMGGESELYTAILPSRPFIINAGFEVNGVDQVIPQFTGVIKRQPQVDKLAGELQFGGMDYMSYFDREIDRNVMHTGVTTDVVIESMLSQLGMSTAQYDLDTGINVIPFALFPAGTKFGAAISQLVEAENGHFYQDEEGRFRFINRQHWDNYPFTEVQRVITTSQVLNASVPSDDHLVNVVEIHAQSRVKQPMQPIMNFADARVIDGNSTLELFFSYEDPVLQVITPTAGGTLSYYEANDFEDGTGSNRTSSVSLKSIDNFAQSSKIVFQNNSSAPVFLTKVVISGRPAKATNEVYVRDQADASVTAYDERRLTIENDYISDKYWAASYARMLLEDYSSIENIQTLTIRAIPELQFGDLVSWQGDYWRVVGIRGYVTKGSGFVQELKLLQRTPQSYFRIGISTIGGSDKIAP